MLFFRRIGMDHRREPVFDLPRCKTKCLIEEASCALLCLRFGRRGTGDARASVCPGATINRSIYRSSSEASAKTSKNTPRERVAESHFHEIVDERVTVHRRRSGAPDVRSCSTSRASRRREILSDRASTFRRDTIKDLI